MRHGYVEVPVTSRAAQAELERQRARRRAVRLLEAGAAGWEGDSQTPQATPFTSAPRPDGEDEPETPDPAA